MTALPPEICGPAAWHGSDMAWRSEWIERLSADDLDEIEAAGRRLLDAEVDWPQLSPEQFPLPRLEARLARIADEVLEGRGFVLMRGLPVEEWGPRLAAVAFMGIGAHFGRLRPQNRQGHLLGHVLDMGYCSQDSNVRLYQTKEQLNFHTDSCDVVALLCLQAAMRGGLSRLVSSVKIFNEMRKRRPDLTRVMFETIETDRRGEVPIGERPFFCIPVFNWHAGLLSTIYQRAYIESARRFPEVPALRDVQIEALNLFDALCGDPDLQMNMEFKPGDMQFVHNHVLLHDRTAFEDWPDPNRKRRLLRLWLAPPKARALPAIFAQRFGSVVPGRRGGISVPGMSCAVPWQIDGKVSNRT